MFTVKTNNKNNQSQADFFVLSHGENAGKPVKVATKNCFNITVTATEILLPEYLYYMVLAAYNAGAFAKYIKGSVIPFITIEDFKKGFIEYYGRPLK